MDHGDVGQKGPAWSLRSRWCIFYSDTLWLGGAMAVLHQYCSPCCLEINQKDVCWKVKRGREAKHLEADTRHARTALGLSGKTRDANWYLWFMPQKKQLLCCNVLPLMGSWVRRQEIVWSPLG